MATVLSSVEADEAVPDLETPEENRVEMLDESWAEDKMARLRRLAETRGDLTFTLQAEALVQLGAEVVEDYETDKSDRKPWEDIAREGLRAAKQESRDGAEPKNFPWAGASDVDYPLLTTAMLQWNARMYPAVIKGDEAVLCKVVGQDNGRPKMGQNPVSGETQPLPLMGPDNKPVLDQQGNPQFDWEVAPGAKAKRARRVSEYLNTLLFYRMDNWESDTDVLLMQLPAVGCAFRKCWFDPDLGAQAALVPALRIYVPKGVSSLEVTPRITEEVPDVFPFEISQRIASGRYRDVELGEGPGDRAKGRLLLEQHRLIDLDMDGLPEPYIVTVDHETRQVLRLEANFGDEDIRTKKDGEAEQAVEVKARKFFVKYGLFPDPEGGFYDLGLAHLLKQLGPVINSALNQLIDAGTAQTAGGGFIGSGVRLQTRGNRGVVRMLPGEYKTVDVTGENLRANIVERTLPNVSPVTFQVLEMILGATRDITGAKDVMTGEASNNGQVGTTLALIEQGLQVFNATAKRCFRSFKEEFGLLYDNVARFGGEEAAKDYATILDDEEADFEADFNATDLDISPVSDPSTVTRMQKLAKAQFIMGTIGLLSTVGGDAREALRRVYEAADVEDIDKLLPPPQPPAQDPIAEMGKQLQLQALQAKASKDAAGADKLTADAADTVLQTEQRKYELMKAGMVDGVDLAHKMNPVPPAPTGGQ